MAGQQGFHWLRRIAGLKEPPKDNEQNKDDSPTKTLSKRESHDSYSAAVAQAAISRASSGLMDMNSRHTGDRNSRRNSRSNQFSYIRDEDHRVKKQWSASNHHSVPQNNSAVEMSDFERMSGASATTQWPSPYGAEASDYTTYSSQPIQQNLQAYSSHRSHPSVSSMSPISARVRGPRETHQFGSIDHIVSPMKARVNNETLPRNGGPISLHHVDDESVASRHDFDEEKIAEKSLRSSDEYYEQDNQSGSRLDNENTGSSNRRKVLKHAELPPHDDYDERTNSQYLHPTEDIANEYLDGITSMGEMKNMEHASSMLSKQVNLQQIEEKTKTDLHSVKGSRSVLLGSHSTPSFAVSDILPRTNDGDSQRNLHCSDAIDKTPLDAFRKVSSLEDMPLEKAQDEPSRPYAFVEQRVAVASIIAPVVRDLALANRRISGHQNTPPIHPSWRSSRGVETFTSSDVDMSIPIEDNPSTEQHDSSHSVDPLTRGTKNEIRQGQVMSHDATIQTLSNSRKDQEGVWFQKPNPPENDEMLETETSGLSQPKREWRFPRPSFDQKSDMKFDLGDTQDNDDYMSSQGSGHTASKVDELSENKIDLDVAEARLRPKKAARKLDLLPHAERPGVRGIVAEDRIAARREAMRVRELSRVASDTQEGDANFLRVAGTPQPIDTLQVSDISQVTNDIQAANHPSIRHGLWSLSPAKIRSAFGKTTSSENQIIPFRPRSSFGNNNRVPSFEGMGTAKVVEKRSNLRPQRPDKLHQPGIGIGSRQLDLPASSPEPVEANLNRESSASFEFLLASNNSKPAYRSNMPIVMVEGTEHPRVEASIGNGYGISGVDSGRSPEGYPLVRRCARVSAFNTPSSLEIHTPIEDDQGCVLDYSNPTRGMLKSTQEAIAQLRRDDSQPIIPQITKLLGSGDGELENSRGYDSRVDPRPDAKDVKPRPHQYRLPRRGNIWRYSDQVHKSGSQHYISVENDHHGIDMRSHEKSENSLLSVNQLKSSISPRDRTRLAESFVSFFANDFEWSISDIAEDPFLKNTGESTTPQYTDRRDASTVYNDDEGHSCIRNVSSNVPERVGQSSRAVPFTAAVECDVDGYESDEYSICYSIPRFETSRPTRPRYPREENSNLEEVTETTLFTPNVWNMVDRDSSRYRSGVVKPTPKTNSFSSVVRVERRTFGENKSKRMSTSTPQLSVDTFPSFNSNDIEEGDEIVLGKVRLDDSDFCFSLRKVPTSRDKGKEKLTLMESPTEYGEQARDAFRLSTEQQAKELNIDHASTGSAHTGGARTAGAKSRLGFRDAERFNNMQPSAQTTSASHSGQSQRPRDDADDEPIRGRSRVRRSRIPVLEIQNQTYLDEKAILPSIQTAKDIRFGAPPGYIADERGQLLKKSRSDESMFAAIGQLGRPVDEQSALRKKRTAHENVKHLFTPLEGKRLRRQLSALPLEDFGEKGASMNRSYAPTSHQENQLPTKSSKVPTASATMKQPAVLKKPKGQPTVASLFRPKAGSGTSHRGLKKSKSVFDILKPTTKEEKAVRACRKAMEQEQLAKEEAERAVDEKLRLAQVQIAALNAEYLKTNIEFTPLSVILSYARRDILEARKIDDQFRDSITKVLVDNNISTDDLEFNLNDWDEYDAKLERFATSYRHDMTYGGSHILRTKEFELPTFRR